MNPRALAWAVWAVAALAGCTEDACIRNSDCPRQHQCTAGACALRPRVDAGPDAGPGTDAGALADGGTADAGP